MLVSSINYLVSSALIHMKDSFFIHFHVNLIHNSPTCWSNSSIITNSIYYPVHSQKVPNGPIIECGMTIRMRIAIAVHMCARTQKPLSLSLARARAHSPSRLNFGAHSSPRTFLTINICMHYCACACKPFFECGV